MTEVDSVKPDACQATQSAGLQSIGHTSNKSSRFRNKDIDSKKGIRGFFHKAIPVMPKPLAIVCCFFNIFVPGLGTFISSFAIICYPTHYESKAKSFAIHMLAFLLQVVGAVIIFGWVWSIKYGLLFIHLTKSQAYDPLFQANTLIYSRRHSSIGDLSNRIKIDNRQTAELLIKLNKSNTKK